MAFSAIAGTNKDQNAVTENLKLAAGQSSPSGQYNHRRLELTGRRSLRRTGTVTRPAYDQGTSRLP